METYLPISWIIIPSALTTMDCFVPSGARGSDIPSTSETTSTSVEGEANTPYISHASTAADLPARANKERQENILCILCRRGSLLCLSIS